jgi:phosphoribosylanthranilate isomerase
MAKIKICGLRSNQDISFVNILKPDYIGFILTNGYSRSIDVETAIKLRSRLSSDIKAVGVFVNENEEIVNACVRMGAIDCVQLHGNEDVNYCKKIDAPIIKVLKPDSFNKVKYYEPYVDYFLFDSGAGTGKTFDWSQIPECNKPFFLAGGLNNENINQAIKQVKPYAVDVSSSVETNGIKDFNKIQEIINIVRNTNE